mgnify:CR=1 FL=1
MSSVIILDKKVLEQYLNQKLNITIFQEIDSTNNYLKKIGSKGEKKNQLVIAESQTGGRGRMGRSFYSPNGTGIYFSMLLHPNFSAEKSLFLTVMAAVAVAETVMKYNKNDVKIQAYLLAHQLVHKYRLLALMHYQVYSCKIPIYFLTIL